MKKVGEYREVTLLPSAYKIYAFVLTNKLEKEIEKKAFWWEKGILLKWQAGFRKERGVVDNIYVLNYLMEENLRGAER